LKIKREKRLRAMAACEWIMHYRISSMRRFFVFLYPAFHGGHCRSRLLYFYFFSGCLGGNSLNSLPWSQRQTAVVIYWW